MKPQSKSNDTPMGARGVVTLVVAAAALGLTMSCTTPAKKPATSAADAGTDAVVDERDGSSHTDSSQPDAACPVAPPSCRAECGSDSDCVEGGFCRVEEVCNQCGCCTTSVCEPTVCPGECYSECFDNGDCPETDRCVSETFCTDNCGCCTSGWCEPQRCESDAQCEAGTVCISGGCTPCGEVFPACDLWCPSGYVFRNGCETCECETECMSDADCRRGETCMPGPSCTDLCMEGDPACCEGNWCAPVPGCEGPSPACDPDRACNPSSCACTGGDWICTADCGPMPIGCATGECGPIPGCNEDSECDPRQACVPVNRCAPSGCTCDASGQWVCDTDCGGGLCLSRANFCPFMENLGCYVDGDCYEGYVCAQAGTGLCGQSCQCDVTTATWSCDDSCADGVCVLPE